MVSAEDVEFFPMSGRASGINPSRFGMRTFGRDSLLMTSLASMASRIKGMSTAPPSRGDLPAPSQYRRRQEGSIEAVLSAGCVCVWHKSAPSRGGVEADHVRTLARLANWGAPAKALALQTNARLLSLSWAVAYAHSHPAYCVRPQPASRTAQPWFSSVPAWEVAIVSWPIDGDAGG